MADVFISYHKESASEIVRRIAAKLKKVNISCWYAERDMPFGSFPGRLTKEIDSCKIFLLVLNQGSIQSEYVKNELHLAFRRFSRHESIILVPFKVDDCEISDDKDMSLYISRFQIAEGNPPNRFHIQKLVERIQTDLEYKTVQPVPVSSLIKEQSIYKPHIRYRLSENGDLTILGTGSMADYGEDSETHNVDTPWWSQRKKIRRVYISKGVSHIGDLAFYDCTALESVVLPESDISIGEWAFSNCVNLNTIRNSHSITRIGTMTFGNCTSLSNFIIHDKVKSVGDWAFDSCTSLTNITILNGITHIGDAAFNDCRSLTHITIPDSVTSVGNWAFDGCTNLTTASIPRHLWHKVVFPCAHIKIRP